MGRRPNEVAWADVLNWFATDGRQAGLRKGRGKEHRKDGGTLYGEDQLYRIIRGLRKAGMIAQGSLSDPVHGKVWVLTPKGTSWLNRAQSSMGYAVIPREKQGSGTRLSSEGPRPLEKPLAPLFHAPTTEYGGLENITATYPILVMGRLRKGGWTKGPRMNHWKSLRMQIGEKDTRTFLQVNGSSSVTYRLRLRRGTPEETELAAREEAERMRGILEKVRGCKLGPPRFAKTWKHVFLKNAVARDLAKLGGKVETGVSAVDDTPAPGTLHYTGDNAREDSVNFQLMHRHVVAARMEIGELAGMLSDLPMIRQDLQEMRTVLEAIRDAITKALAPPPKAAPGPKAPPDKREGYG